MTPRRVNHGVDGILKPLDAGPIFLPGREALFPMIRLLRRIFSRREPLFSRLVFVNPRPEFFSGEAGKGES